MNTEIGDSEYVLLTTFRKSGAPVGTPVWIAPDGDRLLVTTGADSGKVKRLRHTPRITLTPCDARGRALPGTEPLEATAAVQDDPETKAALERALAVKYGAKYAVLRAARKLGRSRHESVPLVIT